MPTACALVPSQIHHTRHGRPSHFLRRPGLSILIDLDALEAADRLCPLLSVDRFNLLSFNQRDYGPNYRSKGPVQSLAAYARNLAAEFCPETKIESVRLLTFPRILGVGFNPVSVYVLCNGEGRVALLIYEVHNTFGDVHSYVGQPNGSAGILSAAKRFHVSPFFPVDGEYKLMLRLSDPEVRLLMRYEIDGKPRLTATLRGQLEALTIRGVVRCLFRTRQWPLRPLAAIHFEAMKLWLKKVPFFRRPSPPQAWSRARHDAT